MSVEQLMLALFVVASLVEGLLRLLRSRTTPHKGQPEHRPSSQLPQAARPLRTAAPTILPRHAAERRLPGESSANGPELPALVSAGASRHHQRARYDGRLQWTAHARGLRPAIVMATILGPCRALGSADAPHDPT